MGFYYVKKGKVVVKTGNLEILTIQGGNADSFIGEISLFAKQKTLYGSVTAEVDTALIGVKVKDIMPLILHDHKGTCRLLERYFLVSCLFC